VKTRMQLQPIIDDPRLKPILDKVHAGERLTFEDGVAMYRSNDVLALGYMANLVRERLHGNSTFST
jgi:aminodeoxyfutalosine synthase